MKAITLGFPVVPHNSGVLAHHIESWPFPYNFGLSSVLVPFLRADEYLGRPREVVDIFEVDIVKFSCIVLKVQDDGAYPLGFEEPPNAVDFCIFLRVHGFILCV